MTSSTFHNPTATRAGRPRILLLPGFLSSSQAWKSVEDGLGSSAVAFSCDLPGFGRRLSQPAEFSLESVVAAIRLIVEAFEPTHIVGHSMGGIIGLALAAEYPQLRGVGAIGLPVFGSPTEGVAFIGRRGLLFRALLSHGQLAHAGCVAARTWPRPWIPVAKRRWKHQPGEVFRAAFVHSRAAHHGALGEIIFGGHVGRLGPDLHTQTFLLHGDADRAAPVSNVRAISSAHDWDLTVVEGGTHQLHVEDPGVVAEWIRCHILPEGSEKPH